MSKRTLETLIYKKANALQVKQSILLKAFGLAWGSEVITAFELQDYNRNVSSPA